MNKRGKILGGDIRQNGMIVALVVIVLLFGVLTKWAIFRPMNLSNLLMQNSYVVLLAIGMFFCILTGNVDLSVGSVVAVTGALMGYMVVLQKMDTTTAVILSLVFGLAWGLFQAFFVAYLDIPPFIVTLAGMMIMRGLTIVILSGRTLSPFSPGFQYFANGFVLSKVRVFGFNLVCLILAVLGAAALIFTEFRKRANDRHYGFDVQPMWALLVKLAVTIAVMVAILAGLSAYQGAPFILLVLIVVVAAYSFIANHTVLGRHVYAVGGNRNAAVLSGVKTRRTMLWVYTNSAILATLAGFVVTARLNAATARAGNGYELDAIAACYIGGASASGGAGRVMGAIIGAAVMGVLNNGMSILGVGSDMQQVIKGFILLLTVTFDIHAKSKA